MSDLDLLSGFSNYGGVYPDAGYTDLGGSIFLEGLVTRDDPFGTEQAPLPVVQLPEGARPEASLTFATFAGQPDKTSYSAARMDVGVDGIVTFLGLIEYAEWATLLSLSGISFPAAGTTRVPADGGDGGDGGGGGDPLLVIGQNYLFRCNNYEFEAKVMGIEPSTPAGRPGSIRVLRGTETGWINVDAISFVWERPQDV